MDAAKPTPSEALVRLATNLSQRPNLSTPFVAPRDKVERTIAHVWSEILGLSDLGIRDNFFALGGDSVQMTQVISRIREQCGVEISFDDFFEYPNISSLAELINRSSTNQHDSTQPSGG